MPPNPMAGMPDLSNPANLSADKLKEMQNNPMV